MATLNIVTTDLTTLNRTRINFYKEPDRLTVIDSLTFSAPHPQRQWTFYNAEPSQAYYIKWTEIDGSGLDIQVLADAIVTMPAAGSLEVKAPLEITANVTPGWVAGQTVVVMDGTAGTDDWRNWDIHLEKVGFGTQFTNENYTWNKTTGTLTLADAISDLEKYWVEFVPRVTPSAPLSASAFTGVKTITANATLIPSDFGKNLILIEGASDYLEVTLPDIATVPEFKLLHVKTSRIHHRCAAIVSANGYAFDWLDGFRRRLYMGICESLSIFRLGSTWQVLDSDGNFKIVGERVSEYADAGLVLNKVALVGTLCNTQSHARLWNDYVDRLPMGEKVTFAAWSTGSNKCKYSLPNGSGEFYVPDLRGLYERVVSSSSLPGDYQANQVGEATFSINLLTGDSFTGHPYPPNAFGKGRSENAPVTLTQSVTINAGEETRPETADARVYVRC